MDLLDLDLTPAKPAGYASAAAAPVVDTSAWGAWWDEVLMLERFARKHQQKDISYLNFNKLSRFYISLFLRIRIRDERLPRWTCLDWDDIKNERKKGVHCWIGGARCEVWGVCRPLCL